MSHGLGDDYYQNRPEESLIQSIGPIARAIDRMPFEDFIKLMVGLSNLPDPNHPMVGVMRSFE